MHKGKFVLVDSEQDERGRLVDIYEHTETGERITRTVGEKP